MIRLLYAKPNARAVTAVTGDREITHTLPPPPLTHPLPFAGLCRGGEGLSGSGHLLLLQPLPDAVGGGEDVLDAVGVGEAQVTLAVRAEAGAGDDGDADFFQ